MRRIFDTNIQNLFQGRIQGGGGGSSLMESLMIEEDQPILFTQSHLNE